MAPRTGAAYARQLSEPLISPPVLATDSLPAARQKAGGVPMVGRVSCLFAEIDAALWSFRPQSKTFCLPKVLNCAADRQKKQNKKTFLLILVWINKKKVGVISQQSDVFLMLFVQIGPRLFSYFTVQLHADQSVGRTLDFEALSHLFVTKWIKRSHKIK